MNPQLWSLDLSGCPHTCTTLTNYRSFVTIFKMGKLSLPNFCFLFFKIFSTIQSPLSFHINIVNHVVHFFKKESCNLAKNFIFCKLGEVLPP